MFKKISWFKNIIIKLYAHVIFVEFVIIEINYEQNIEKYNSFTIWSYGNEQSSPFPFKSLTLHWGPLINWRPCKRFYSNFCKRVWKMTNRIFFLTVNSNVMEIMTWFELLFVFISLIILFIKKYCCTVFKTGKHQRRNESFIR